VTTLYGIKNCDSVRKARRWLADREISYEFHDLRTDGVDGAMLARWVKAVGWESLLNRRGTTWRQLPQSDKTAVDAEHAIALMLSHPTLIKRPVVEHGKTVSVGFDEAAFQALFER